YVKVTIDVPGREPFVANVADGRFFADPVDIGDPVLAWWAPEDVHLLTGGLGRSVRVTTFRQAGDSHGQGNPVRIRRRCGCSGGLARVLRRRVLSARH